jgi:hypothetical protein
MHARAVALLTWQDTNLHALLQWQIFKLLKLSNGQSATAATATTATATATATATETETATATATVTPTATPTATTKQDVYPRSFASSRG